MDGGRNKKLKINEKDKTSHHDQLRADDEPDEELDTEEEEERNRDFFEQMVYWKFEDNKKKAARSIAEVAIQKNVRNNSRG